VATSTEQLGNLAPCRVVAYVENLCGQLVDAVLARLGHLGALQVANVIVVAVVVVVASAVAA